METNSVETPTLTTPADQDDSPPGGVVISPLPPHPITPMEADVTKPTSPSTAQNNETDRLEIKTAPEENPVQIKPQLK